MKIDLPFAGQYPMAQEVARDRVPSTAKVIAYRWFDDTWNEWGYVIDDPQVIRELSGLTSVKSFLVLMPNDNTDWGEESY